MASDEDEFMVTRQTEGEFETENLMRYDQKFLDKVRVWVMGGKGGTGSTSFNRENYQSRIPDGGSGGDGGDVFFKANSRLNSLHDLRRAHFKGNNGKPGRSGSRHGLKASPIYY